MKGKTLKLIYSGVYADDCHPFNALCSETDVARNADDLQERDSALVIWGGSDINPAYYNHPTHSTTYPGGARDRVEWTLMQRAIEMGIPIIGVCRGAQMLCAAAGGYLIQDVNGHAGHHEVVTYDNETFRVNSIHHQMMVPDDVEHTLIGWASPNRSFKKDEPYYGYKDDRLFNPPQGWREPEFVYFPKVNGYAIQWHPEMMPSEAPATQYVLNFIKRTEDERNRQASNPLRCEC